MCGGGREGVCGAERERREGGCEAEGGGEAEGGREAWRERGRVCVGQRERDKNRQGGGGVLLLFVPRLQSHFI